jgi:selenide,water dikinase
VLCGLPRLESEDLIVGIESADDAGVMRVSDELAIIHTTDFFPPMVDDPYTFGRIAATNALSDVWAMGGTPLAAMNLVSYPLKQLGKEPSRRSSAAGSRPWPSRGGARRRPHRRGRRAALRPRGHRHRPPRQGVAQRRCTSRAMSLILTKPLGTGLVTTAAKGGMADPDHLATAMRWMTTLNRDAAEALHDIEPHAVTDVTGFGLAGHAAEMAEASGCAIEIDLEALPAMPGALDAAATGLVPVGAGKNRTSIAAVLEIADGADELRVDLALDPQTSGGLLAAIPADRADALVRRLPGAAVVGRVTDGKPGAILLR